MNRTVRDTTQRRTRLINTILRKNTWSEDQIRHIQSMSYPTLIRLDRRTDARLPIPEIQLLVNLPHDVLCHIWSFLGFITHADLRAMEDALFRDQRSQTLRSIYNVTRFAEMDLFDTEIAAKLPNLHSIQMRDVSWQPEQTNTVLHLPSVANSLKTLSIANAYDSGTIASDALLAGLHRLQSLTLKGTGIADFDHVYTLTTLRRLDLTFADVTHLSSDINTLESLRELILQHNPLTHIDADVFLPSLHVLDLGFTNIAELDRLIDMVPNLEELGLRYCDALTGIDNVPPSLRILDLSETRIDAIPFLPQLEELNISGNRLLQNQEIPSNLIKLEMRHSNMPTVPAMAHLQHLEMLDLHDGDFENFADHAPSSLTYLDISHNRLAHFPPTFFTDLETLSISHNPIHVLGDLRLMNNLQWLDASGMYLTAVPRVVFDMPSLRHVDLSGNSIETFEDVDGITQCHLQSLNLADNNLREIPPFFNELVNLQTLHLESNEIAHLHWTQPLPYLKELYMTNNALTTIPTGLLNMPSIRVFEIAGNNLPRRLMQYDTTLLRTGYIHE